MLEMAFMLAGVFRELLALGFCYRVGGQFIRLFKTLTVLLQSSFFIFFCTMFCAPTWVRWVAPVISDFVLG
jgi:hypothetical protein